MPSKNMDSVSFRMVSRETIMLCGDCRASLAQELGCIKAMQSSMCKLPLKFQGWVVQRIHERNYGIWIRIV
ncbi:hypothetical protein TNIN_397131 [Trichonephila inaurata madagascariensis]|uniref:Uncharacterized protein n=1 Tax=Trichonephila inaurata madagascariensis TaxID=2747483 RepID=A0A8X7C1R6_9ARAC|nr:hypothetical protein TNIN_397131 [Trichonephila inaurata madagascariensis]